MRFLICLLLLACTALGHSSSTIYDGVIVTIDGEVIVIKVNHSPYSSVPVHSLIMTHKDGTFKNQRRHLNDFATYYVDEIPVSKEQFLAVLKPGMRMATMENRDVWYFCAVTTRMNDSAIGFIKALEDNRLTLERPQIKAAKAGIYVRKGGRQHEDGNVHLTFDAYPLQEQVIELDESAVVRSGGTITPWKSAGLVGDSGPTHKDPGSGTALEARGDTIRGFATQALAKRTHVLVQAARPTMRVELIPPGYGDWKTLVNDNPTKGTLKEMRLQFLGIATGNAIEIKDSFDTNQWWPEREGKIKSGVRGFGSYLLAGGTMSDSPLVWRDIYRKGESALVDGYYASDMKGWVGNGLIEPGRFMVNFIRRGRGAPDRFAFSSENPIAWGTVTAIDGDNVTLSAPEIEGVPVSGEQSLTIPADARTVHLGQDIPRDQALVVGSLLQIYGARPQTILLNGG